ncbi:MAG: NFACT family protein [Candidatus Micrarchaeota archaeon]
MPFALQKMSNLDYFFLSGELQPLVGGFVSKIYELRPNVFRFKIRSDREYNLIVELGLRAHLSKYIEESPEIPTNFAMLLRKHLENSKITEIKQENEDRLLIFTLQKVDEYHLIFEMFAKGNLILATADYTIIAPYKTEQTEKRSIKRHESYIAIPNPNRLLEKPQKQPTVYFETNEPVGFAAFASSKFENAQEKIFLTISEMADEYYYSVSQLKTAEAPEEDEPSQSMKKLEFTLRQQQTALRKFESEMPAYQEAGNYVYRNFELVKNVLRLANESLAAGMKESEICKEIAAQYKIKAQFANGKLVIDVEKVADSPAAQ